MSQNSFPLYSLKSEIATEIKKNFKLSIQERQLVIYNKCELTFYRVTTEYQSIQLKAAIYQQLTTSKHTVINCFICYAIFS